ncbi:hypothetical protein PII48_06575 [Serratia sp. 21NM0010]|uniref:hypothetical protein n=1 Tax=Serratia TaxID=613 RepID=UPI001865F943|nr:MULTISPECIES: hypothetical protein [Serratia]MDB6448535.1 hypothetical protein [Serratia sp. 21NM0010]
MNRSDYVFALSEREQVSKLLNDMPADRSISRISLESRLKKIEEIISKADLREHEPTKATLTFKGPTVMGTHGISASFGTKAVAIFNDAIAYVASAFNGALPVKGKIPDSDSNHLMITSSARGSFGFVLEEFRPDAPLGFDEQTLVSKALDKTQEILQASLDGDDEKLSEALEEMDKRALDKVRSFIQYLIENKTVFSLKNESFSLVFREPKQLERACEKLSSENIKEEFFDSDVYFLGTLPNKRQCEFMIVGETEILTAKISKSVENPDIINKHLGKLGNASFSKKTVGNGKPRFTLIALPTWQ